MTPSIQPYSEMRETDLSWLGEIPSSWGFERLDRLFILRKEEPKENDERVTAYINGKVTARSNVKGQKIKGVVKETGWQRIHSGDFAISGMNAHIGGMGVSDSEGKCSPIYLVLEPKKGTNAYFVSLVVRYLAQQGVLKSLVNTIRYNSADFKRDHLKLINVWLPPLEEQQAIVRYLDHMDRRIQRYIRARKKMIKLLEEQKQAIIHQAVTRGLDPNVPLKPSGVEWLGDIPSHWIENRGKYLFKEKNIRSTSGAEELLSVSHITGVTPRSQKNITMFLAESNIGHKICDSGDIVINTMWAWKGALGVAKQHGIISPSYHVYEHLKDQNFLNEYLDYLLRNPSYISEYVCRSTGIRSSRLRMYPEDFLDMPIIMPPYQEQLEIMNFLSSRLVQYDISKTHYQNQINSIEEYRINLISNVVTGKIDIRGIITSLPGEVNVDEFLDEEDINEIEGAEEFMEDEALSDQEEE